MVRKREVTERVREHVANKLRGMVEFHDRRQVAARLGLKYSTLNSLINGHNWPSKEMADFILHGIPRGIPTECPHCGGTGKMKRAVPPVEVELPPPPPKPVEVKRVPTPAPVAVKKELPEPPKLTVAEKIVPLPKGRLKELELQNEVRRASGLDQLKVKVVRCMGGCGKLIESIDTRMCTQCRSDKLPVMSGQEIYI